MCYQIRAGLKRANTSERWSTNKEQPVCCSIVYSPMEPVRGVCLSRCFSHSHPGLCPSFLSIIMITPKVLIKTTNAL